MSVVEPRMTSEMGHRGWAVVSAQSAEGGRMIDLKKGDSRARLLLKPYDKGRPGTGVVFEIHDLGGGERE